MAPVSTDPPRVTLTIEEVLGRIVDKVNVKLFLVLSTICFCIIGSGFATYITVFTAYIPYNEWTCKSEDCTTIRSNRSDLEDAKFYSYETLCGHDLVAGRDVEWTSKLHSFSMEWGYYCGSEAKVALMSSIYFLGCFVGLLFNQTVIDRIGRKKAAVIGVTVSLLAAGASAVARSYAALLVLRVVAGFGMTVSYTSVYCWVMELCPPFLRNPAGVGVSMSWCAGYLGLVGVAYLTPTWHYIYLALAGLHLLALIPFFFSVFPESPRFYLLKGEKEAAVRSLKTLAMICDSDVDIDSMDIVYETRTQSYLEQIKDFSKYPLMLKQTLLGSSVWFLVALLFYSYMFGWAKIGGDLYSSYVFAAIGETLGYLVSAPVCRLLGRKRGIICCFGAAVVCDLAAMIDWDISAEWSLEHVISIIGSICVAAAFALIYLISSELAPTSHRGMILCISSGVARIGSFLGSNTTLLYGLVDRRVPLTLFAVLAGLACVVMCFLPDTTHTPAPNTPNDVCTNTETPLKAVV